MATIDKLYHQLSRSILEHGYEYSTDNREVSYKQITDMHLDVPLDEFPLITTKKMFTEGVVQELLWFLKGKDNIKPLVDAGVNIWNKDTYAYYLKCCAYYEPTKIPDTFDIWLQKIKDAEGIKTSGDAGRNYGVQWRNWSNPIQTDCASALDHFTNYYGIDQIRILLDNLRKDNPITRRHIVTAWNPAELNKTALPPCHWAFEILPRPLLLMHKIEYAAKGGADKEYLNGLKDSFLFKKDEEAKALLDKELEGIPNYGFILKWHQRSVDTFLGLPFNIASYALLAHIIGSITDLIPMSIIGDLSNVHFYTPHISKVEQQLNNSPIAFEGCQLRFSEHYQLGVAMYKSGNMTFDEFLQDISSEDFIFEGYQSFPAINAEMYEPTK